MKIKIELFAICRDLSGSDSIEIDINEITTTADILNEVVKKYPVLAEIAPRSAVAVGDTYKKGRILLKEGVSICIIPPVSGG